MAVRRHLLVIHSSVKEPYNQDEVIARYKQLIRQMPRSNQYLLLYVLDLLSVFARKSDKNLMTAGSECCSICCLDLFLSRSVLVIVSTVCSSATDGIVACFLGSFIFSLVRLVP